MKAIVHTAYGKPEDVLRLRDVPEPAAGAGEVVVRVRAASLHPDVWHLVTGRPFVLRLMGAGLLRPRANAVPGTDAAGVVEAVGAGVDAFRIGEAVWGEVVRGHQWRHGGAFAERVVARAATLAPKPEALSFDEAAALGTAGLIALRCLREDGRLRSGHRVLVNGAAGGVGSLAVQIAKADGARVTGVDLADKLDLVRALGADEVIDGGTVDFTRRAEAYDLILDVASNRSYAACRRVLAPGGRYVLVGHDHYGAHGRRWLGSVPRGLGLLLRARFDDRLPRMPADDPATARSRLDALRSLAEAGRVRPIVDRAFPLAEAVAALRELADGRARSRIVLRP